MLRALCFHKLRLFLAWSSQHLLLQGWALVARGLATFAVVKVGHPEAPSEG